LGQICGGHIVKKRQPDANALASKNDQGAFARLLMKI